MTAAGWLRRTQLLRFKPLVLRWNGATWKRPPWLTRCELSRAWDGQRQRPATVLGSGRRPRGRCWSGRPGGLASSQSVARAVAALAPPHGVPGRDVVWPTSIRWPPGSRV